MTAKTEKFGESPGKNGCCSTGAIVALRSAKILFNYAYSFFCAFFLVVRNGDFCGSIANRNSLPVGEFAFPPSRKLIPSSVLVAYAYLYTKFN